MRTNCRFRIARGATRLWNWTYSTLARNDCPAISTWLHLVPRVEKEECGRHARGTEPASSVFETIFERILIFQSVRMNVPLSYLYYREFSACAGACAWHVSLTSHMISHKARCV